MRKEYCQACSFARYGVKTRKAIHHTCGIDGARNKVKYENVPTKEELDKYLARLKELMEEDIPSPSVDIDTLQAKKLSNDNPRKV